MDGPDRVPNSCPDLNTKALTHLRDHFPTSYIQILRIFMLNRDADIHAMDDDALRAASEHGHFDIVELLLNRDADIHALDDDALCVASEKGHLNVVELLLDKDADMHANDDYSLRRAYENGHMAVVELLCQQTNCAQPR